MFFGSNKKIVARIDNLYKLYENLQNFDELYKKIMESYQSSKALIQEQVLNYDKKIIQQNTLVETTLVEFKVKLDKSIKEAIEEAKYSLEENKKSFEQYRSDLKSQLEKVFQDYRFMTEKSTIQSQNLIDSKISSFTSEQSNALKNQIETIKKDVQMVLGQYELNLTNLMGKAFQNEISKILIEDIAQKGTDKILLAFNKSLMELQIDQKDSIIDAITSMLNKNLDFNPKDLGKKIIKPLEKNEFFHKSHDRLKTCIEAGIVPMIVGPAGTGKSTAVEQISRELKLPFYMANRIQNTFELVGFVNASGKYITTQFYEAFTKGGLFLFDEVDASSPEALVTINAALAQGYMAFPGHPKALNMHPDFKVVCAGNTSGSGSTIQYNGRNKLDSATLDRFMIIEWDYDTQLEDSLVKDKALLEFCWKLRQSAQTIDPSIIISSRGMMIVEKLINQNKKSNSFKIEEILKLKFFETTKKESIKKLNESVKDELAKNIYLPFLQKLIESPPLISNSKR